MKPVTTTPAQSGDYELLEPALSLSDVAHLLNAGNYRVPAGTQVGLEALLRATPSLAGHLRELEQLMLDAAVSNPQEAYRANRYLDHLLAADPHQHPAHILSAAVLEAYGPVIARLARSRAARADDPSQLEAFQQRLEKAMGDVGPAGYRAAQQKGPSLLGGRLSAVLLKLERAGLQRGVGFPPGMIASQLAWPTDSPLSEAEVRAEIQQLVAELEAVQPQMHALEQRAEALSSLMPAPRARELEGEVPWSVYAQLSDVVMALQDGLVPDDLDSIRGKLAETPESLRQRWLGWFMTSSPDALLTPEADQLWAMFVAGEVPTCSG